MKTARNPWYNPKTFRESHAFFTYPGKPLFAHRGVEVFYNTKGYWDYVLEGVTIAQRAGFGKDTAPAIIDGLLDGSASCCEEVATHIRAQGFTPMSYNEYLKAWHEGKVE